MAQASIPTAAQSGNNAPTPVPFVFKGSQVRTVMFENHPWFVTKDVCAALGISWNGKLLASMPEGHVQVRNLRTRTRTGQVKTHKTSLINKPGAHQLAARSKSPEAEEFSAWLDTNIPTQPETEDPKPCVKPDNGAVFFAFNEAQVRVIMKDDSPWFVGKDVCTVLGTDTRDLSKILDEDEKGVDTIHTPGGPQRVTIVNESGLYSLIMRSRKPEAKAFKKWVTSEVLPTIRRQGRYEACPSEPTPKQIPPKKATREERRPLVELVRSWVAVAPIGYGQAHKQVNAVMGVSSIDEMTPEQVREAMVWVTKRIEEAHACKTEQQQSERAKALPGSASHAEAIREIGARIDDDIEMFRRTLEKRKHELVEVLGPRIWWGQRRARDLSPEHKARCQTSHTMMLVVEDAFTNILYTARTLRGVVRAQAELEQAAELVHPVEDIR